LFVARESNGASSCVFLDLLFSLKNDSISVEVTSLIFGLIERVSAE